MVSTAVVIVQALAHVSLSDAAAFVRRFIALVGTACRETQRVVCAFFAAIKSATAAPSTHACTKRVYTIRYAPKCSTTTFFAIDYEIADWTTEIVNHEDGRVLCIATPVYKQIPSRAPIESFYPEYETIETTEVLDVTKLLAQKYVCSVMCQEITAKTLCVTTTTDDEATASESDGEFGEEVDVDRTSRDDEREHVEVELCPCDSSAQNQPEEEEVERFHSTLNHTTASNWHMSALDVFATAPTFDWTIGVYQNSIDGRSAVGSMLLQRRLLGL